MIPLNARYDAHDSAKEALEHPYWAVPPIPKPASAMPTFPTAHDLPEAGARGMSGASAGGAAALKRKVRAGL
jgi:hypothetical protein